MRKIHEISVGMVVLVALGASAQAQTRGRMAGPSRIAVPASHRVIQIPRGRNFITLVEGGALLNQVPLVPIDAIAAFPVPGLGFDFVHLAAVTRHVKVSDFSVLTTAQRLALSRRLTPILPIAFPVFTPAQVIVVQQPPVVILQAAAAEERVERVPIAEPTERAELRPPALAELSEFVLLRRDGKIVFAVAFSAEGDRLIYVTRDGIRRSFSADELDREATLRINEERGTIIRLPDSLTP